MCGIVGLFLKDKSLEPKLGAMLSEMLVSLSDRGPDSAGIAIYGSGEKKTEQDHHPVGRSRAATSPVSARNSEKAIGAEGRGDRQVDPCRDRGADRQARSRARGRSSRLRPAVRVMGAGEVIEIFKEVGLPAEVVKRFGLTKMAGHARHRPHPHGDRERRHDASARIPSRPGPTSASCTTARCPTTTMCAAS